MNADQSVQIQLLCRDFDLQEVSRGAQFQPMSSAEQYEFETQLFFDACRRIDAEADEYIRNWC